LKKLKTTLDQKQKALEAESKRQQQDEENLRKEQAEWKDVNTKRQELLEADLQSKISSYADKETEYVQKWSNLEESKKAFQSEQNEQSAKLEALQKEAQAEFIKVQQSKNQVQEKERRLEEQTRN